MADNSASDFDGQMKALARQILQVSGPNKDDYMLVLEILTARAKNTIPEWYVQTYKEIAG